MDEEVAIAGREYETPAELEGIFTQRVLAVAGGAGAPSGGNVLPAKQVQQIGGGEAGGAVSRAVLVDEERKGNAGLFAENAGVAQITQADGGESSAPGANGGFVFAQPGDVLATEDSTVVAEENQDGGSVGP